MRWAPDAPAAALAAKATLATKAAPHTAPSRRPLQPYIYILHCHIYYVTAPACAALHQPLWCAASRSRGSWPASGSQSSSPTLPRPQACGQEGRGQAAGRSNVIRHGSISWVGRGEAAAFTHPQPHPHACSVRWPGGDASLQQHAAGDKAQVADSPTSRPHVTADRCRHAHSLLVKTHSLVAPLVEQVQAELVLGVDDPHKQQAVLLQPRDGQLRDVLVRQLRGGGGGRTQAGVSSSGASHTAQATPSSAPWPAPRHPALQPTPAPDTTIITPPGCNQARRRGWGWRWPAAKADPS